MSSYRKTMGEVYNGMYLVEGNIDKIKDIVSKKKATKIDGVMVDLFTASAISQVYDKAGSSTKKKMEILPITKLASVVMKMMGSITNPRKMKNDYVPEELDLDEGTWHIAKNMNALKKKMQKPIPKNDLMVKFVMKHIGDDVLADEMFDAKTGTDMVPMIKSAMKRLNIKEEVDLDEGPNKMTQPVIVMRHKNNKNLSVSVLPNAKDIKKHEKKGMRIDHALVPSPSGNAREVKDPKEIMKLIKGGDKLKIGEEVDLGEDYVLTVKGKEVNRYKSEKDARKAFHDLVQQHGHRNVKVFKEEVDIDEAILKPGMTMKVIYKGKKVQGKVVRRDKGEKGGSPFYVVDVGGIESIKVPDRINSGYNEEADLDESVIEQLKSLAKGGSRYKPKSGAVEIKDDKGKVINKLTPEGAKKVLDKMKDPISGKSSVPDRTRGGAEKKIIDIVKNFKEEADLDEASARGDAKRSMSRDRDFGRKDDLDKDDAASDDDVKAASKNIMMQLRKAANLRGTFAVEFGDKKKVKVDPKVAQAAASKYNSLRRPADKEKFQSQIAKSYKDMLKAIKEAVSPAQQAAIAISKKERGEKPKKESRFNTINKQLKGEK